MYETKKIEYFSKRKTIAGLAIIVFTSMIVRIWIYPHDFPIIGDGFSYFWFANDISILGKLPNYTISNDGWPIFLSFFFSLSNSENLMDYVSIQRSLSIVLSLLTIIPIFFLSKNFIGTRYSLIATSIFAFEPRIIQNSILGITEPLYIFLLTISLALFFSKSQKFIYVSFFIIGLATIVRTEGVFLAIALSVGYFIYYKKNNFSIPKIIIMLGLFFITILIMFLIHSESIGPNPIVQTLETGTQKVFFAKDDDQQGLNFGEGIIQLIKFTGWDLIPVFIIFTPLGLLTLSKKLDKKFFVFITIIIFLLLPALYAYSSKAFDTRYIFPLYPIFTILAIFGIAFIERKLNFPKYFSIILVVGILFSSIIFISIQDQNRYNQEILVLTPTIIEKTEKINQFLPQSSFIPPVVALQLDFPILKQEFESLKQPFHCSDIQICPQIVQVTGNSLEEYIEHGRMQGLTHLVITNEEHFLYGEKFLSDVYSNEGKYDYFTKIFDSNEKYPKFTYHIKIFQIDYEKFDYIVNKK